MGVAETDIGRERKLVGPLREKEKTANYRYWMVEKERDEQQGKIENNPIVVIVKARLMENEKGMVEVNVEG